MKYRRKGRPINPRAVSPEMTVPELIDEVFQAYNSARLREACQIFTGKMLSSEVTVGLSLSGALTPAGLGRSCLVPLMEAGFVDWMVSTGANLYHDAHHSIGHHLYRGNPVVNDADLREEGIVRIYDILFDYEVLLSTDRFLRRLIEGEEFQERMSSARFHHLLGKYLNEREQVLEIRRPSILSAAYQCDVPIYTSSPGDSSIGMNIAAQKLRGNRLSIDVSADVNETAALVLGAKRGGGRSAVVILGGGSPKNFLLQTEPQLQEVLGIEEKGHDYFLQFTDARPDTGGLSGATPAEAVSWGKVDPEQLPDAVVCYVDCTIALPLLTSYALNRGKERKKKRLVKRVPELLEALVSEYERARARQSSKTAGHED